MLPDPTQSQMNGLKCADCGDTFQRKGHLQRHLLRHTGSKSHRCSSCSKTFSRSDTLLRHQEVHDQQVSRPNNNGRKFQACTSCAKSKQRCDGIQPCARCVRKRSPCNYPKEPLASRTSSSPHNNPHVQHNPAEELEIRRHDADHPRGIAHSSTISPTSTGESSSVRMDPLPSLLQDDVPDLIGGSNWPASYPLDAVESADLTHTFGSFYPHDPLFAHPAECNSGFPLMWMAQTSGFNAHITSSSDQFPTGLYDSRLACMIDLNTTDTVAPGDSSTNVLETNGGINNESIGVRNIPARQHVSFPLPDKEYSQSVRAELFGRFSAISRGATSQLRDFYIAGKGYDDLTFPDDCVLHAFVELYFEHFDPEFPFLHHSQMRTENLSWILFTAVAATGSQYSEIKQGITYTAILQDLLHRAIHSNIQSLAQKPDISFVQSLLLRDLGCMFSGSVHDQTKLQYERNLLVTLCRSLATNRGFNHIEGYTNREGQDSTWQSWLKREEMTRFVYCVYMLECFELLFFDLQPLFKLTDLTQNLPCAAEMWKCHDEREWLKMQQTNSVNANNRHNGLFTRRIRALSLYVDERSIVNQMQSSQLLRSLIVPETNSDTEESDPYFACKRMLFPRGSGGRVGLLDKITEENFTNQYSSCPEKDFSPRDLIVHVIGMLREIPLQSMYASMGWQASGEEVERSKERLKKHLSKNASSARICLWHAAHIYTAMRHEKNPGCHASLAFCISLNYIFLYDQLVPCQASHDAPVRPDKLVDKPSIEAWKKSEKNVQVHITGIGILDGRGSSSRLLLDASKILTAHKSWTGIARGLAQCCTQILAGQRPHI